MARKDVHAHKAAAEWRVLSASCLQPGRCKHRLRHHHRPAEGQMELGEGLAIQDRCKYSHQRNMNSTHTYAKMFISKAASCQQTTKHFCIKTQDSWPPDSSGLLHSLHKSVHSPSLLSSRPSYLQLRADHVHVHFIMYRRCCDAWMQAA